MAHLRITADDISRWGRRGDGARTELPRLIRKLVQASSHRLSRCDFPAGALGETPGPDGIVEGADGNAWVPNGDSWWELSTRRDVSQKASEDYEKATRQAKDREVELKSATFVFATTTIWTGTGQNDKTDWAEQASAPDGDCWANVRAYDASDLEQWIEEYPAVAHWLAEQIGKAIPGALSLDEAWRQWSAASTPPLGREFYDPLIERNETRVEGVILSAWLKDPQKCSLTVSGESRGDAVAFLACAAHRLETEATNPLANALVVRDTAGAARLSSQGHPPTIMIVDRDEMEAPVAALPSPHRWIIAQGPTRGGHKADIVIGGLRPQDFTRAIEKSLTERRDTGGVPPECEPEETGTAARLRGRMAGWSRTVYRRRYAKVRVSREWTSDENTLRTLARLALVGAWKKVDQEAAAASANLFGIEQPRDQEIVESLTQLPYEDIEATIAGLHRKPDAPVWIAGLHRGVVSKLDLLFGPDTEDMLTEADIRRFMDLAEGVLGEEDPALSAPVEERWHREMVSGRRSYSDELRDSMTETIVLLSANGVGVVPTMGDRARDMAQRLVARRLDQENLNALISQQGEMQSFAEAAPNAFLAWIERDLKRDASLAKQLMRSQTADMYGGTGSVHRTGLLWALEALAWAPERFGRVVKILGTLAEVNLEDNIGNTPSSSLYALLCTWLPQTDASAEQRLEAMQGIAETGTAAAWSVLNSLMIRGHEMLLPTARPTWLQDSRVAGGQPPDGEIRTAQQSIWKLLVAWPCHTASTLTDLVTNTRMLSMPWEAEKTVWKKIYEWNQRASDKERGILRAQAHRERIGLVGASESEIEKEAYRATMLDALQPSDCLERYAWLFASHTISMPDRDWLRHDPDGISDAVDAHHENIHEQRTEAVAQIVKEHGLSGLAQAVERYPTTWALGICVAQARMFNPAQIVGIACQWTEALCKHTERARCYGVALRGLLAALNDDARKEFANTARATLSDRELTEGLLCLPNETCTWELVDKLPEGLQTAYWERADPEIHSVKREELEPARLNARACRFLTAGRPAAALTGIGMYLKHIEGSAIHEILTRLLVSSELHDQPRCGLDGWTIKCAFDRLRETETVSRREIAALELAWGSILVDVGSSSNIPEVPCLEAEAATDPAAFVELLSLVSRNRNESHKEGVSEEERQQQLSRTQAAYRCLESFTIIPGTRKGDHTASEAEGLAKWMTAVHMLCAECGRTSVGEETVGRWLGRTAPDEDGTWPSAIVSRALEMVDVSEIMLHSMVSGRESTRGVHWRDEGGKQERELAATARGWANTRLTKYPKAAQTALMLAESYERWGKFQDDQSDIARRLHGI